MIGRLRMAFIRACRDECGQILPFMLFLIALMMGAAGLCVDLGHAYACHRQLQASTDAAALAGAEAMGSPTATSATVNAAVSSYSSVPGGLNANANLQETATSVSVSFECLSAIAAEGVSCSESPTGANAIQVTQMASVPTFFIRALAFFGVKAARSLNIGARATAAVKGSQSQFNVAIVLDATQSMNTNDTDANCGNTRIHCALQGVQALLQGLSPCTASSTSSDCTPFDQVSLFTFPNVKANTAQDDTSCGSGTPSNTYYSTPVAGATWTDTNFSSSNPSYQIADYGSDYSSTNEQGGAFNTSSALVIAAGGGKCQGIQAVGGYSTYYAGAVYAALSSLAAAQQANAGSSNALIILSDGDANAGSNRFQATNGLSLTTTGLYPSAKDECQQAITAAQSAKSMTRTTVYTIAYGAPSSGCSTDSPSISPCSALQQMATSSADFYSDATASQNKGQCVSSANSNIDSLSSIFQSIGYSLSGARLIPDDTP